MVTDLIGKTAIDVVKPWMENTKSTEDLPHEFGELLQKEFVFGIEIQKTSREDYVKSIESINLSPNNNKESTEIILIDDESHKSSSSKSLKLVKVKIEPNE
ncbi:hypothetical protein ACFE04_031204 [Oxalis oulophora]